MTSTTLSLAMQRQNILIQDFAKCANWEEKYKKLIQIGKEAKHLTEDEKQEKFLVKGCQSQVWLIPTLNKLGQVDFKADSDALIVKGLVILVLKVYSGLTPDEILQHPPHFIKELGFESNLSPSRANGLFAMIKQVQLYATAFKLLKN